MGLYWNDANDSRVHARNGERTMTTNFPRESAQIYQFPARGRFAAAGCHDQSESVVNLMSARIGKTVLGGAWYHEEAIRDDQGRN